MLENTPVIIASSLTGLVISRSLSNQGIHHILIGGDEPDDTPRLGESMNEGASIDCWRFLGPEFKSCFYTKSHISLLNGKHASMLYTGNPNRSIDKANCNGNKASPFMVVNSLIHVDRIKLDKLLYHQTRASHFCTFIRNSRAKIAYDADLDKVTKVELGNDECINNPSFVFDATGPFGLVARAADIGKMELTDRERVVWTHYGREPISTLPKVWWLYGTNLLRLEQAVDGIDGIAWLIPLGNTISVGVSVEAATYRPDKFSAADVMQLLDAAFARRGVNYRSLFPETKVVKELEHAYFIRHRAYGSNWLLAGGSYLQIWFPSSSGFSMSTLAAHLAPHFINGTEGVGRFYEQTMHRSLRFHDHIHDMIKDPPFTNPYQAQRFWSHWYAMLIVRFSQHLRAANNDLASSDLIYKKMEDGGALVEKSEMLQAALIRKNYVRTKEVSDLAELGQAFPGYFTSLFFLQNSYAGLLASLRLRLR